MYTIETSNTGFYNNQEAFEAAKAALQGDPTKPEPTTLAEVFSAMGIGVKGILDGEKVVEYHVEGLQLEENDQNKQTLLRLLNTLRPYAIKVVNGSNDESFFPYILIIGSDGEKIMVMYPP